MAEGRRRRDPLPPAPGRPTTRRAAVAAAALALAFACATAQGLRAWVEARRAPDIPFFTVKLDYWRSRGAGFSVLVYGTSIALRGVDPRALDGESRRLGRPTRSFNGSLPGLDVADQGYLLERYLRDAPASLAWVVLEPALRVGLRYENVTAERVVAVHRPGALPELLELVWAARLDPLEKLSFSLNHALSTSYHAAGAGVLAGLALPRPLPSPELELDQSLGFSPLEDFSTGHSQRRQAFDRLLQAEAAGALEAEAEEPAGSRLAPAQLRHLRGLAARVGGRARLAWLLLPSYGASRSQAFRNSHRAGELPGLLVDLDDPERHPDARNPAWYWDRRHLNAAGARELSIRLARELASAPGPTGAR